jgi:hypothetical protein
MNDEIGKRVMNATATVNVLTPWEHPIEVPARKLSILSNIRLHAFRSLGVDHHFDRPHHVVKFSTNRGTEYGIASADDLRKAGIGIGHRPC